MRSHAGRIAQRRRRLSVAAVACMLFLVAAFPLCVVGGSAEVRDSGIGPDSSASMVRTMTPLELLRVVNSTVMVPRPLVVYFSSDAATDGARNDAKHKVARGALLSVASTLPAGLAEFVEVPLTQPHGQRVARAYNIPAKGGVVAQFGARLVCPWAPPGSSAAKRPYFTQERYRGELEDETSLRRFVLGAAPTRYADQVTYRPLDSVTYVFSVPEVYETSKWFQSALASGEISVVPQLALLFYVDLTTGGSEELVAAISSFAAQVASRLVVFATEVEDVAAEWGLSAKRTAAVRSFPLRTALSDGGDGDGDGDQGRRLTAARVLHASVSLATVGSVIRGEAFGAVASAHYERQMQEQEEFLRQWEADVASYLSTCPLRKLEHMEQYRREILHRNQSFKALFVLRESDVKFFPQHLRLASEFAAQVRSGVLVRDVAGKPPVKIPVPGDLQVFWIDAEFQQSLAASLHVTQVPSVVFLFPLQSGSYGLRMFTEDDVKGRVGVRRQGSGHPSAVPRSVFPESAHELVRFFASADLLEAVQRGMRPFFAEKVPFAASETGTFIRERSHRCNKTYVNLDVRFYPRAEIGENMYVRRVIYNRMPLQPKAGSSPPADGVAEPQAKITKMTKRKAAEGEKLRQELEAKRQEREARIERKKQESARLRQEEKRAMQERLRAERQEQASGTSRHRSGARGGLLYPRPKPDPSRPASSRFRHQQAWSDDGRRGAREFVWSDVGNAVRVVRTLERTG